MQTLLIALQFLTRFPVRLDGVPTAEEIGRSLLTYPLVGALLGLILVLFDYLFGTHDPWLEAALLLVIWVSMTGALHLDGLADSADAWLGGRGDRQRSLSIMKDPRSGPAAVAVIVLVLLIKFAALTVLLRAELWQALLLAPILGRASLIWLFLTTPYVREKGLGRELADHLPRVPAWWVLGLILFGLLLLFGWQGLRLCLILWLLCWALRWLMMKTINGTTGDTAGAMLELVEAACLLILAW
ncbi:MAG: adenosylcobinamide-GDP ribazoletransferase [Thiohalomonadaceae bacterium]